MLATNTECCGRGGSGDIALLDGRKKNRKKKTLLHFKIHMNASNLQTLHKFQVLIIRELEKKEFLPFQTLKYRRIK